MKMMTVAALIAFAGGCAAALAAERSAVYDLRNRGMINDEVMRAVVRDLDLEDERLEI